MTELNLVFAFTAGMFATINPCGWALLPAFISYYLGSEEEGYESESLWTRAAEGIKLGILITSGFLLIFAGVGLIASFSLRFISQYVPLLTILIGFILIVLGVWQLRGKAFSFQIPQPDFDVSAHNPKAIFLYGVGYGIASLSCTLPIFLSVIGASLTVAGYRGLLVMFTAYGLGMAVVLMSVAMSVAVFKGVIEQWFRKMLPYVHRIGAILLIVAGGYLVWYQGQYLPYIFSSF